MRGLIWKGWPSSVDHSIVLPMIQSHPSHSFMVIHLEHSLPSLIWLMPVSPSIPSLPIVIVSFFASEWPSPLSLSSSLHYFSADASELIREWWLFSFYYSSSALQSKRVTTFSGLIPNLIPWNCKFRSFCSSSVLVFESEGARSTIYLQRSEHGVD